MIPMEVIKERLERYEKELPLGRLAEMPVEIGTVLELIRRVEVAEEAKNTALRENDALRREMLTPKVFSRLVEWLRDPNPKNASGAFTAGLERQIAYALEMDVLPEVKSLRIKLANAEKDIQKLRSGEFICQKCGLRKDADRAGEVPF